MKNESNDFDGNTVPVEDTQPIDTPVTEPSTEAVVTPVDPVVAEQPAPEAVDVLPATPTDITSVTPTAPEAVVPATPVFGSAISEPIPVDPTAAVAAVGPAPQKKKKGLIIGIIIAAALVLIGGGSALAYNFVYQNPEKVVGDAIIGAVSAKTVSLDGKLNFDMKGQYTLDLTIDADTSTSVSGVNAKLAYKDDQIDYTVDGSAFYNVEGELYVKFVNVRETITALGEEIDISYFEDLITKIDGNWIKITNEDVGSFSEEYKKTQQCLTDASKSFTEDKAVTKEVSDLYRKNKFIVIGKSLGSKDINGVGSLGYEVSGDKAKAEAFVAGFEDTQYGKKIKECDPSIDFSEMFKSISEGEVDPNDPKLNVEIWASRFGHELTELNANIEDDEAALNAVINPVFNKEVKLDKPTEFITFEELQTEIQNAYMAYYMAQYAEYEAIN